MDLLKVNRIVDLREKQSKIKYSFKRSFCTESLLIRRFVGIKIAVSRKKDKFKG